MGKKDKDAIEDVTDAEGTDGTEVEGTKEKKAGRGIVLTLADGSTMKRTEYCRKRADEGASRTQIAKELTDLQGKPVPYQIAFAATKGHPAYVKKDVAGVVNTDAPAETEPEAVADEAA